MGAYLNKPDTVKVSEDETDGKLKYGASAMQGWRISQEDAHNCCVNFDKGSSLFAVYDGHGGQEVAEYTADNLPDLLKTLQPYKDGHKAQALEDAFLQFDATILDDDVMEKLKVIAQVNIDDEDQDEEEEEKLQEEADMPIEELMKRYGYGRHKDDDDDGGEEEMAATTKPKPAALRSLRKKENFQSPMIRAKKGIPQTNGDDIPRDEDIKLKLEDQLVNGHTDDSEGSTAVPDSTESTIAKPRTDGLPGKEADQVTCSSSDSGLVADRSDMDSTEEAAVSSSTADSGTVPTSTSSSDGISSSVGGSSSLAGGSSSLVSGSSSSAGGSSSSAGGSSSLVSGSTSSVVGSSSSAGGSSSSVDGISSLASGSGSSTNDQQEGSTEPSSSTGRTRKARSGVIPVEDEDESSFDEDEEDTDDDSDKDAEPWKSGSDDDDESEDDEMEGPFVEGEDNEDDEIMCGGEEPGKDSGCTAVVALLDQSQLHVANAGDSRCVLCRGGQTIELSKDHKPEDDLERKRIENAGGRITRDGRVNGGLNLSRAIGDHRYKNNSSVPLRDQMISALPDLRTVTIGDEDEFMVLACDGIWNVMSSQDVVAFVRERLKAGVAKLSSICEEMFDLCLAPDTTGDGTGCDNMTCIIVTFGTHFPVTDETEAKPILGSTCKDHTEPSPESTHVSQSSSVNSVDMKCEESTPVVPQSVGSSVAGDSSEAESTSVKRKASEDHTVDSSDSKRLKTDETLPKD